MHRTGSARRARGSEQGFQAGRGRAAGRSPITVEIADTERFAAVAADWRELAGRAAEPNVFMEPAMATAAAAGGAQVRVLLAWRFGEDGTAALAGAWALRIGRPPSRLPLRVLTGLSRYAFLGTPVVERGEPEEVMRAMLDLVALSPELPKTFALHQVATQGPAFAALARQLAERQAPLRISQAWSRPCLASPLGGENYLKHALSSGTRKKLRQHRRRLEKLGRVEFVRLAGAAEVERGFERFLALEAAGWKGKAGTAIASSAGELRLARSLVEGLAADGLAWLETLTLDGEPIAMQVMLRSGEAAYTWRTAYDERYAGYSPGVLLLQAVTTELLDDPGIGFADSCSHEAAGYMADLWQERLAVADICLDVRPGRPLPLRMVAAAEAAYCRARRLRRQLKQRLRALA